MLRNQVITEWNNLKKTLLDTKGEFHEKRVLLSKLKLAEWKTYAKKAYLINGYGDTSLSETLSRWDYQEYYKIVNNPSGVMRKVSDNIVASWKVTNVKCLVVEEGQGETLTENIFNLPTFEKLKGELGGIEHKPEESSSGGKEQQKIE